MQQNQRDFLDAVKPFAREGVRMSELTSFQIGGVAFAFAEPKNKEELLFLLRTAKAFGIEPFLMGNGTNLLISDEGLDRLVIRIGEGFSYTKKTPSGMEAGAGTSLRALSHAAAEAGLSGMEWACGIPGTVGGAVAMNAGAYSGEVKDVISRVDFVENGEFFSVKPQQGDFGYRKSAYSAPARIVLAAEFALTEDNCNAVFSRIEDFTRRREEKQPLEYPSAGSVFKRPAGHYTGALIEAAGMKGASLGGAQVSEKHAGFIINRGGATFKDVLGLIRLVQKRVYETSGVTLETEIKTIGTLD